MKKITTIIAILCLLAANTALAARVDVAWQDKDGTYLEPVWSEGRDLLILGTSKYINFNSTNGTTGYGFRDNGGTIQFKSSGGSWASLGSAIIGTWSTTTSSVSGQVINYPNGNTDIVTIGNTATGTAKYFFDPNTTTSFFTGNLGLGSTSPFAKLSLHNQFGTNNSAAPILTIASSTAAATTTLFEILANGYVHINANVGIGTSTPSAQFTLSNTPLGAGAVATTTFQIGDNATTTSVACFNTKNTAGGNISFYFVATTMVVENNACR